MTQLSFDKRLYSGKAIDAAIKVYGPFATVETEQTDTAWVVKVSSEKPARERKVSQELANQALGLTIQERRSA